jgi:hypothetical protein
MTRPYKLECLSLESLSSQVLEFEGKARGNPILRAFQMLPSWVSAWCYQQMLRLHWKVITRYKHSSLFGLVVGNEGKKFYNIDTWLMNSLKRFEYFNKILEAMDRWSDINIG